MAFEREHFLLIELRLLEFHIHCSLLHKGLVMLDYITATTFEKPYNLLYIVIIFLLRYTSDAATLALADMIVQARTEFTA